MFAEVDANTVDADASESIKSDERTDPYDKTVLRFFCTYDGSGNGGSLTKYTLNYFVRDGTVEVLEEQGRNTGLVSISHSPHTASAIARTRLTLFFLQPGSVSQNAGAVETPGARRLRRWGARVWKAGWRGE